MTAVTEPSTKPIIELVGSTPISDAAELHWPAPQWATGTAVDSSSGQVEISWSRTSETVVFNDDRDPQAVGVTARMLNVMWLSGENVHLSRPDAPYILVGNESFSVGETRKLITALTEVVTAIEDSETAR
jgi:hypothetical protein